MQVKQHDITGKNKDQRSYKRRRKRRRLFFGTVAALTIAIIVFSAMMIFKSDDDDEKQEGFYFGDSAGKKIIVLDPGHGSADYPGCIYGGIYEKDLNLNLAYKVKNYLEEFGYYVVLTRRGDDLIMPDERAAIAGIVNAEAFISIHHNALENDTETDGIETWYNGESNPENETLAGYVQSSTSDETGANNRGLRESLELIVTREAPVPSCLVEAGFMSNPRELALLVKEEYQDLLASGIAKGINEFIINREGANSAD